MSAYERTWFCRDCANMYSHELGKEYEVKTISNHGGWKCQCGKIADNLMPTLAAAIDSRIDPELIVYRDFYNTWETFQNTNANTNSEAKKLTAARDLINAWDRVKNFRNPVTMLPAANG